MQVAICIATHRRPKMLESLLEALQSQTFDRMMEPGIQVIVADNDASGSAEPVCRTAMTRWPLTYHIEPRRGIAQARNCALRRRGTSDFIVFIDDDETPDTRWLEELLLAQAGFNADVVTGPVIPVLPDDAPYWIKQGHFYDCPPFTTGQVIEACATNNTLVARSVFDQVSEFDEQFQLSGADDLHFFRRVHRAGFKIVWCKDAIVSEAVTPDRANLSWLLRRAFRGGNGAVLVESALDGRRLTRALRFAKAWVRIGQGLLAMAWSVFKGRTAMAHAMRRVSLGAGMLAGLFAFTYQSHQSTTGE